MKRLRRLHLVPVSFAFFASYALAIPDYTIVITELSETQVCTGCTGHGLGEVDGEIITYATNDSDSDNLLAYSLNGSFIEIAPDRNFDNLLDSDGRFVAFSQFGQDISLTAVDYNNPGVYLNPEDTSTSVDLGPFGVNTNGDLAGDLDGLVSGAFTSEVASSRFLPGPETSFGIALDINDAGTIVVGESDNVERTLDIATLWQVDDDLEILNSFFIGSGEGEANIVGDTQFDSQATVIFTDNGASSILLLSTAEIFGFGSDVEILTATPNAFLLKERTTDECFLAAPGPSQTALVSVRTSCVDATEIGGVTSVLFLDGTVRTYNVSVSLAPDNASLVTAVLPSSRSVQVDQTATAFMTAINTSSNVAQNCQLIPRTNGLDTTFFYQATNPATNAPMGSPNEPVAIAAGQAQSFVFGITPGAELAPMELELSVSCDNAAVPVPIEGLSTLLLSASTTPVADVVALAATVENDGIVRIEESSASGIFSVASVNVGDAQSIQVSVDTGSADLPTDIFLCETNPTTGVCINPTTPSVDPISVDIGENETPTFGVFVFSMTTIPLDPANSRVFVRFQDEEGVSRGATSVALTTR